MERVGKQIGVITRGSLLEGLEMKLDSDRSVEDIKAGNFVVIRGQNQEYFAMITDVRLEATNPDILVNPPAQDDYLLKDVLAGSSTYAIVSLRPMLAIRKDEEQLGGPTPKPVKSIPSHFSAVHEAVERDVARIFGSESWGSKYFSIGRPLDMDIPVCINLDRLVERSNGIFGKTGTGKTFLTRLVLSGLIKHDKAVNFVFDMHSEYGWEATKEGEQTSFVKGLAQLFPGKVAIFTLDPDSTRKRGVAADHEVYISMDDIMVEDIAPLQEELRLNPTAVEAANLIVGRYRERWLRTLLSQDPGELKDFAEEIGAHPESIAALYRKLKRIEKFSFVVRDSRKQADSLHKIMEYLRSGKHVVLEFGRQTSMLCYLLVANIISRRIHEYWVTATEKYQATHNEKDKPPQLVITIEEAHKFLNPTAAKQTIFGTIAREMRKYFVTLLVVDQRPSGIDDEVLSQLGTRIVALLNDDKDISAVLTGVSNTSGLRGVLASLDSKQQALVIGHAVPMPVVVRTRTYDEQFYRDMGYLSKEERTKAAQQSIDKLFGK